MYTGVDEAGMGPYLGPLSICRCSVLAEQELDLIAVFQAANIPVADSKKIYSSGSLAKLEQVALAAVQWLSGWSISNAAELFAFFHEDPALREEIPWMQGAEKLLLPLVATEVPEWEIPELAPVSNAPLSGRLLHPRHINRSYAAGVNKLTLELNTILELMTETPGGVDHHHQAIDRLGGRAYYAEAIQDISPGPVTVLTEEKGTSSYAYLLREQPSSISFLVKGEDRNPLIAMASCIAKYARELHMHLLNTHWTQRMNWLKHTAGYPQDAKRWLFQIGEGNVNAYKEDLVRGNLPDIFNIS